jgi:hypothetical protein
MFNCLKEHPQDTLTLVKLFYKNQERPLCVRETVMAVLVSLMRKIDANNEPFKLIKSQRRGPIPVEWHLAPRTLVSSSSRIAYAAARLKVVKSLVEAA